MDVATLGLSVKSSEVKQGARSLDDLSNAAARAEAAAEGVGSSYANASKRVASAAAAAERAIEEQTSSTLAAANANMRLNKALNDNAIVQRHAGGYASNLAAQFQDVAVSAAMGMNPMQVALQQGTQMAMVFSDMALRAEKGVGAISLLGSAFATVLSPMSLTIIALTALSAAGLQMINWTGLAQASLRGLAAILPTIAPYAAAAAAGLALLYAPAIIGGVTSLVALISKLGVELLILAGKAAIANPFAAFVLGAGLAIAAMVAFRDDLTRLFGVDIVGVIKDWGNWFINLNRAAIAQLTVEFNNFPELLKITASNAANNFISGIEWMVNKAIAGINRIIEAANDLVKMFGGDWVKNTLGWDVSVGTIGEVSLGRLDTTPSKKLASDAAKLQDDIKRIMSEDTLGNIGSAIGKGASAATAKLKEWATQLGVVEEKSKKAKTEAEKFADIIAGADRRIASLQAEAAAYGLTEEAAARLRYEQDLLNQASQKDITLSVAQRAELAAKAATMAQVETAAKKVKESYDFVRDGLRGFIDDLRTGLQQGQSFWEAFGNAAINVLNKIIAKIEDQLVNALLNAMSAGLGGMFGFGGGTVGATTGAVYVKAASGGYISGAGTATSDSIPAMLSNGEYVVNASATRQWGPLLDAINDNRIMKMAAGGAVGWERRAPDIAQRMSSAGGTQTGSAPVVNIYAETPAGTTTEAGSASIGSDGSLNMRVIVRAVQQEFASDLERMGPMAKAMKGRFGLNPVRGMT